MHPEVADPGQVEHVVGQIKIAVFVAADVARAFDQVAWLAATQFALLFLVAIEQPVDRVRRGVDVVLLGVHLEDLRVLLRSRVP